MTQINSPSGRPLPPQPSQPRGGAAAAAPFPAPGVALPGFLQPGDEAHGNVFGNQGAVPEWGDAGGVEAIAMPGQEIETDMVFVRRLYKELLQRDPDPEGFAAHVVGLSKGATRAQIRQTFLTSPEYQEVKARPPAAAQAPGIAGVDGAAPGAAAALPPATKVGQVPLEGYDGGKLNNPDHRTPKYLFGRVASNHGLGDVSNHAQAEAKLKAMVPELEAAGLQVLAVSKDKLQVVTELGVEWVDVVRGAGAANPGWWWGSEGKGTPIPAGAVTMGGQPVKPVGPGGVLGAPGAPGAPAGPGAPANGPLPAGALPSLPNVPVTGEFANAPIDKSSVNASLMSAATWVKDTYPHLFTQGDDRVLAFEMMSKVIGALRAHGVDAYRIVNHHSLPKDHPNRYGSDALVVGDQVYDVYGALGEANRPQVLHHGTISPKQSKE